MLKLTAKRSKLKDSFVQKMKQIQSGEEVRDEAGNTAEYYRSMNMDIPEELKGTDSTSLVVSEDDYDYEYRSCYLQNPNNIQCITGTFSGGCEFLYKLDGIDDTVTFIVEESADEVYKKIQEFNTKKQ